jgi:hypothetical protein
MYFVDWRSQSRLLSLQLISKISFNFRKKSGLFRIFSRFTEGFIEGDTFLQSGIIEKPTEFKRGKQRFALFSGRIKSIFKSSLHDL